LAARHKVPNLEQRERSEALDKTRLLTGASDGRLGPITQQAYAKFQGTMAKWQTFLDAFGLWTN